MRYRLRDLVLTVTAIGLLLSLAGPMLVARREAARKDQCQNNLRQLALGCLEWEAYYGTYPPAITTSTNDSWISTGTENGLLTAGPNWASNIAFQMGLPALGYEVDNCLKLYAKVPWNAADDCEHVGAGVGSFRPMGTPGFMTCPAAVRAQLPHTSALTGLANLAKGNYAACIGSGTYLEGIDGSAQVDARLEQEGGITPGAIRGARRGLKRGIITVAVTRDFDALPRNPATCYASEGYWRYGRGRGRKVPSHLRWHKQNCVA